MRMIQQRRREPLWAHPPILMLLLLLAFAAGVATVWIVAPLHTASLPSSTATLAPQTPAPLVPTSTPRPTPTPTMPERGDVLETLYIDIAPDDFAKIEAKRQEALKLWILLAEDSDFVPATLHWRGMTLSARARLKGDWADHLVGDKWSFRVELRGDGYLDGMRVFSIHDPSMRTYLNEWLFHRAMRREGVLSVGYGFVRVVLNGEDKGIYALEEGFAKELLESQQRREGVIVRYAEDLLWRARAYYDDQVIPPGIERFYIVDEFNVGRVRASPALQAQRDAAIGLLRGFWDGKLTASEVFDMEAMGKFLALSDLWDAPHGLIWHNLRYAYNPVTARLEPISFDSDPFSPELDFTQVGLPASAFYDDPHLQAAYARELWRISQPGYVEALEAELGPQFAAYTAALTPEFGADALTPPWDWLRKRQDLNRQRLTPAQMVYAYLGEDENVAEGTLSLRVGNLMDLPVELVGMTIGDEFIPAGAAWKAEGLVSADPPVLAPLREDARTLPYITFTIPAVMTDATLKLVTRVWGVTQTVTQTIMPVYPPPLASGPRPTLPTLAEALAQHPYLRVDTEAQMLTIPPGVWDVRGDLRLPEGYGLRLAPGTTLTFGAENFLLATGPLIFEGAEDAPILLRPRQEEWQGIVVLEATQPSLWRYVTVEAADALNRQGWMMTGGITFYRSPIRLEHSRVVHTQAEDGLNVIRARFTFVDSEFGDTRSDGIDVDFGQGVIERCVFHDIGADAVDVSGSEVQVRDVRMVNLGDKGLSVGEMSRLTAERVSVENADFGVVSKDLSQAFVADITIQTARVAGLAAYIKKPAYGPASITAKRVTFVDVPAERQTLVQTGSWIDLDGVRIWGIDVDIDALYEKWQK